MPNRIVRESILTSSRVDALSDKTEVFYRRLLSKVDDHGLYDARPSILRASLYPLRLDRVKDAECMAMLDECRRAGLVVLYERDAKRYLRVLNTNWQIRAAPKYPPPDGDSSVLEPEAPAERNTGGAQDLVQVQFEEFWKAYPKKVAKPAALKAWRAAKLANGDCEHVMSALKIARASEDWKKSAGQFIPHPASWLNGRRWLDQVAETAGSAPPSITCRTCRNPATTWTDGQCDPCWRTSQGIEARP